MISKSTKKSKSHVNFNTNSKKRYEFFDLALKDASPNKKSLYNLKKCVLNKCDDKFVSMIQNIETIAQEMEKCNQNKYKKDVKQCLKKVSKIPAIKNLKDCIKQNCNKEHLSIKKQIKKPKKTKKSKA
jgi:hypothetical protein